MKCQHTLVTELRLAEAATIDDANRVLADFLPRFNQRFRVPPQHTETAYRVLDPQMCLDTTLCLKYRRRVGRDNTVKYRWRTLQLLPGTDRPSYAGAVVDVLEGVNGGAMKDHRGGEKLCLSHKFAANCRGDDRYGIELTISAIDVIPSGF